MLHRDRIVLEKIIKEIEISDEMLGAVSLEDFLAVRSLRELLA